MIELEDRDQVLAAAEAALNASKERVLTSAKKFTEGTATLELLHVDICNFRYALADLNFIRDNTTYPSV